MKKMMLIFGVMVIGILAAISLFIGGSKNPMLTVTYKNISGVTLTEASGHQHGNPEEEKEESDHTVSITQSGEKVSLEKDTVYMLRYEGADGYADGEQVVNIDSDETIELNPSYSEEKLNQMLQIETSSIQATLNEKYPKINLYKIQPGKLYQWGDWYGTTLIYNGPYTPYRDTLRLVMKKEDGSWKIMTDPPYISLSRYSYPDVPVEILDEVNNLETPKPEER